MQTTEQYEPEIKNIKRARPAKVTVIGTVTSREDGQVIPGVKVMLKGTSTETLTNAEGQFALDLKNSDSTQLIVFSFPGFKTVEYIHNTTRPGQEIAVDMECSEFDDVVVLSGMLGGGSVTNFSHRVLTFPILAIAIILEMYRLLPADTHEEVAKFGWQKRDGKTTRPNGELFSLMQTQHFTLNQNIARPSSIK